MPCRAMPPVKNASRRLAMRRKLALEKLLVLIRLYCYLLASCCQRAPGIYEMW